ncbi:MAG TPA: hypothetical protein VMS98_06245 [Thermoanaerobaculia bacterium]|nr:hypothetical protein [Thermoanaerobaculia bacterium]
MLWPLLMLHICCATAGLLSGFLAMSLRKGSGWHGAAGNVFFVSMLGMSVSAAYIAAFLKPNAINVVAASLTFYLVVTARRAARQSDGGTGILGVVALLFAMGVGAAGLAFGLEAANSPKGSKDGIPAAVYIIFGSVALLCAVSDIRMLVRGGVSGGRRIARHLVRMGLALAIATISFYPGQAKLFPGWLRETGFLFVPHILLIGSIAFWMVRVRLHKRLPQENATGARRGDAAAWQSQRVIHSGPHPTLRSESP